jgi:endonuclease YncB( thermonuclease family)
MRIVRYLLPCLAVLIGLTAFSVARIAAAGTQLAAGPDAAPQGIAAPDAGETVAGRFTPCDRGEGTDCVIDGDTIRVGGEAVQIADIDAPEARHARCNSERALGLSAAAYLVGILNQGPFMLVPDGDRDTDVYGRKLRRIERGGRSLGMALVAEGLARPWSGARVSWCA